MGLLNVAQCTVFAEEGRSVLDTGEPAPSSRVGPTNASACEVACSRFASCSAPSTPLPMSLASCMVRCQTAQEIGGSEEGSVPFRVCASQRDCEEVRQCGKLLKHPAVVASCASMCRSAQGESRKSPTLDAPGRPTHPFAADAGVTGPGRLPTTARANRLVGVRPRDVSTSAGVRARLRVAGPPATLPAEGGTLAARPGGILLTLEQPGALAAVSAWTSSHGLPSPQRLRYGKELYFIDGVDEARGMALVDQLNHLPGVRAELDVVHSYSPSWHPNDPSLDQSWTLSNPGGRGAVAGIDGRVLEAWDITAGSPNVVVGVLDDGVDVRHPELASQCLPPMNYPSNWEEQVDSASAFFASHGTRCAGVIAATADNGIGSAGVCPHCTILPYYLGDPSGNSFRVTNKQIADSLVAMTEAGAWIISNSWGPSAGDPRFATPRDPSPNSSSVVRAALEYAETYGRNGKGTLVLFASGNGNEPVPSYIAFPTGLIVSAVDDQGLKAFYSDFGPAVSVVAPSTGGVLGVFSTGPNVFNVPGYDTFFGGTSAACAFAAGVAGLVMSANESLTAAQVRALLKESAMKIDPVWGQWGSDGRSPFYGAGLVNAHRAVQRAVGLGPASDGYDAPSDVRAGAGCTQTAGARCRTQESCAPGLACEAIPSLGTSLCVAPAANASCLAGNYESEGFCLPSRDACGLSLEAATCGIAEDDCDAESNPGCDLRDTECVTPGYVCPNGRACAGLICTDACASDADCTDGTACYPMKNRYGQWSDAVRGCAWDSLASCAVDCEVLASLAADETRSAFIACIEGGEATAQMASTCRSMIERRFLP